MGDKEKVLQETREAYGELRETVSGLDEAQVRAVRLGTWGVREIPFTSPRGDFGAGTRPVPPSRCCSSARTSRRRSAR